MASLAITGVFHVEVLVQNAGKGSLLGHSKMVSGTQIRAHDMFIQGNIPEDNRMAVVETNTKSICIKLDTITVEKGIVLGQGNVSVLVEIHVPNLLRVVSAPPFTRSY